MKKFMKKLLVIGVIAVLMVASLINVSAEDFDFNGAIANFTETSFNSKTLKVGQTDRPSGALWVDGSNAQCYISDSSVITINNKGDVTAVGEGVAYIAIVPNVHMYEITKYTVVSGSSAQTSQGIISNNNSTTTGLNQGSLDDFINQGRKDVERGFAIHKVFFTIVACFIAFVFVLLICTFIKCKKLDNAIKNVAENPSEETAKAAVKEFSNMNSLLRLNIASGSDTRGVHFIMWREVFNNTIIPCPAISSETKQALRNALIRLNTHSLHQVIQAPVYQDPKAAKEVFGSAGEDNVWHNLKYLPGCDIYKNVKIRNGNTCSEIDAVIVDPTKGIFLLEIKSVGGRIGSDGNKYITYDQLKEDPTNQMFRHEFDFKQYFAELDLCCQITNLLVFSWPKDEDRRFINQSSFPSLPYEMITVEQFMAYYGSRQPVVLTEHERKTIASKLMHCSGEYDIK